MIAMRWLSSLGVLGLIASCPAVAQDYPSRVVTIVVPNAPGGPSDLFARWIGNLMSKELGQQIIVENVGGASGTIGASRVAQAAPDGIMSLKRFIGHGLSLGKDARRGNNKQRDPKRSGHA